MRHPRTAGFILLALALTAVSDRAQAQSTMASGDSAAVAAVVTQFHGALEQGDSAQALGLLSDDAIILESGGTETKAEYRAGHLRGDIAFARAVSREQGAVRVVVSGDAAWASSSSLMRGTYRDREIHSRSVELMVLRRTAEGWRIAAIHWSSRALGDR